MEEEKCEFNVDSGDSYQGRGTCIKPEYQVFANFPKQKLGCMFTPDKCPFLKSEITTASINEALETELEVKVRSGDEQAFEKWQEENKE